MKIDYELAEKIGATHYCDKTYRLYKVSAMTLLVYIDDDWKLCLAGTAALCHIKPIPPKPPVRVEYEKVGELGWHVWQYLQAFYNENVDWFFKSTDDKYMPVSDWFNVAECIRSGIDLYSRIEKPVDWRDEVCKFIDNATVADKYADWLVGGRAIADYDFLEMCRVALRANGEL